jgi:DNA-binding XRE family transcriptional regulator
LKRYGGDIVIKTNELRGVIVKNGYTQSDVAGMIGITPKTFYEKMKNGVFGSNEIQIMIDRLHIEDPVSIFFAKE